MRDMEGVISQATSTIYIATVLIQSLVIAMSTLKVVDVTLHLLLAQQNTVYVVTVRNIIIIGKSIKFSDPGSCNDGDVRLTNGTIVQEGRAEVCINGVWSSICQNGFNTIDGYVFCSQLGYDGASKK